MSKKKATKKKRPASAARRPTKARSSRARRPSSAAQPGRVHLKPILVLIERAIVDLRRLPPQESVQLAIKQLEVAQMAIGDICDPETPGGCGPTMEFPPPPTP